MTCCKYIGLLEFFERFNNFPCSFSYLKLIDETHQPWNGENAGDTSAL